MQSPQRPAPAPEWIRQRQQGSMCRSVAAPDRSLAGFLKGLSLIRPARQYMPLLLVARRRHWRHRLWFRPARRWRRPVRRRRRCRRWVHQHPAASGAGSGFGRPNGRYGHGRYAPGSAANRASCCTGSAARPRRRLPPRLRTSPVVLRSRRFRCPQLAPSVMPR